MFYVIIIRLAIPYNIVIVIVISTYYVYTAIFDCLQPKSFQIICFRPFRLHTRNPLRTYINWQPFDSTRWFTILSVHVVLHSLYKIRRTKSLAKWVLAGTCVYVIYIDIHKYFRRFQVHSNVNMLVVIDIYCIILCCI